MIDHIIAIFSPTMRYTLELRELTKLLELTRDKKMDPDTLIQRLQSRKWKYAVEEANLLVKMANIIKQAHEHTSE